MADEHVNDISGLIELTFSDNSIESALQDTKWFTPLYIESIINMAVSIPTDANDLPTDPLLLGLLRYYEEKPDSTWTKLQKYVRDTLITSQGNVRGIENTPCLKNNQGFLALASSLGFGEDSKSISSALLMTRAMVGMEEILLKCLIAPHEIREAIITRACAWNKGDNGYRSMILIWSEMVRLIAKEYVETSHASQS